MPAFLMPRRSADCDTQRHVWADHVDQHQGQETALVALAIGMAYERKLGSPEDTNLNVDAKWSFIAALDDELLKGGANMSERCAVIVRDCDYAFVGGANLATVITATAAIETYLRAEYADGKRIRLADLIDNAPIEQGLREDIHKLRKYRNTWVHVATPGDDEAILQNLAAYEDQLEEWAKRAQRTLRLTIYENQWV